MKKFMGLNSAVLAAVLVFSVLSPGMAHAATQAVAVPTQVASDNPHVNSDPNAPTVSYMGTIIKAPLNSTTTQIDDDTTAGSFPSGYTWRLTIPELCEGAQLNSLRIVTETNAADEEADESSGIILGLYGSSDLTMFDQYTIHTGEDMNTWAPTAFGFPTPLIDRGVSINPSVFPAGLTVDGILDGTWDISSYTPGEPLGIYIQQWITGTTTAQTTIQSVTLTYDDSGCSSTAGSAAPSEDVTGTTLASTGESAEGILWLAGLSLLLGFVLLFRQRLASRLQ